MDRWSPETTSQRHKRSFTDMSQSATLSPSPMNFGDPSSNFLSGRYRLPLPNDSSHSSNFERRRTSHPHNPPIRQPSESMAQLRPRIHSNLESEASVIDLTDEAEERPVVAPRQRDRSYSHRPPQLGRSDAVGVADFIDLTDDAEPDIIITGDRILPPPANFHRNASPHRHRAGSPPLFLPPNPPPVPPPGAFERLFAAPRDMLGDMFGHRRMDNGPPPRGFAALVMNDFMDQMHAQVFAHNHPPPQAMPGRMDYQNNALALRKAEHVPPPAAREGFTRSPVEKDTVICPSCEQEMIHRKDVEEPVAKKNGKAPTRKEREEHPFWVVKECGHVYCNHCFQHRSTPSKTTTSVSFPEISKVGKGRATTKVITCTVEGCVSEVKNKDKWIGVFL